MTRLLIILWICITVPSLAQPLLRNSATTNGLPFAETVDSVRTFGAKGDGVTDDTAAIQAAINNSTAIVYFPTGTYRLGSINMVGQSGRTIRGAGMLETTLIPITSGHPMLDVAGGSYDNFENFQVISSVALPSCAILLGRTNTGSAGAHRMSNVRIAGVYGVAGVYSMASEDNVFQGCFFGQSAAFTSSNAFAAFYSAKNATNIFSTPITSLYCTISGDGSGGNSFNAFRDCSFLMTDTRPDSVPLILEYYLSHTLDGCFSYSNGATNHIRIQKSGIGLSVHGLRQEAVNPYPFHGIFFADGNTYRDTLIRTSCVFPIGGLAGSKIGPLDFSTSYFNGTNGLQTIVFDVDIITDSQIFQSDRAPDMGNAITDARWRIRSNTSVGNRFGGINPTNLVDYATNQTQFLPLNGLSVIGPLTNTGVRYASLGLKASSAITEYWSSTDGANPFQLILNRSAAGANAYWSLESFENGLAYRNLSLLPVSGNVGIGKTIPTSKLDVAGDVRILAAINGGLSGATDPQPIGLFGSMMLSGTTNTVTVGSAGTYYALTNYGTVRTNGFGANKATGFLTNTVAGYYRVTVYVSMISGASDTLEAETFLNETGREEISLFGSYDAPARIRTMSSTGVLYIPANTGISLRLNNRTDNDNITVWRAGLTVGTP